MPSVFNHDNSCWGVKRSFCNVFQYDLHREEQHSKSSELGLRNTNSIRPSPSPSAGQNSSIQYSVSSNGYYGYQPHSVVADQVVDESDNKVCDCSEDNTMEVDDNTTRIPCATFGNTFTINCNILNSSLSRNVTRKRHMLDSAEDVTKRMRQNEHAEVESGLPTHVNHRKEYFSHPKCLMSQI